MNATSRTAVTLRAIEGEPLKHERIRDMVKATALAIAERQGVGILDVETSPESISVTLATGRLEAVGFAAELRRLTTRWYTQKFGVDTLWGEVRPDADDIEPWTTE